MSSSDGEPRYGTIFMGPTPDRETTLDRLYDVTQRELWNQQTEQEYLERVKAKATERVRALLLQARQRGDAILREAEHQAGTMRAEAGAIRAEAAQTLQQAEAVRHEAESLRGAAHDEGFEAGHAEAMAELAQARRELGEATGAVLLGIHEQCGHIFEAWRGDMAALLREAVEKATGWVMDADRAAVLEQLLDRSIRALLDRRNFTVRVNPVDAALVTDMLADAHRASPRVDNWELATDPLLEPGSLIVESESGLVNNSREARISVVDEVLEHLTLPMGQADEDAFAGVTETLVRELRKNGVDLENDGEAAASPETGAATPPSEPNEVGTEPVALNLAPPLETAAPVPPAQTAPAQTASEQTTPPPPPEDPAQPALSPLPDAAPARVEIPAAEPAASLASVPEQPAAAPAALSDLSDQEARELVRSFLETDESAVSTAPEYAGDGMGADEDAPLSRPQSSEPSGSADPAHLAHSADAMDGLPPDLADELLADMGFAPDPAPSVQPAGEQQPERA